MDFSTDLSGNIKLKRPLLNINKKYLVNISSGIFGKYFNDPSNKNEKYLRTKLEDSNIH